MAKPECPKCGEHQGQSLSQLLAHDGIDYYLCAKCGHMWTVTKGDGGREVVSPVERKAPNSG